MTRTGQPRPLHLAVTGVMEARAGGHPTLKRTVGIIMMTRRDRYLLYRPGRRCQLDGGMAILSLRITRPPAIAAPGPSAP